MKSRPIIFSGEMVRAILDGRKTQTRRVVKPRGRLSRNLSADTVDVRHVFGNRWQEMFVPGRVDGLNPENLPVTGKAWMVDCPYGTVGDRLWVRETWAPLPGGRAEKPEDCMYRADPMFKPSGPGDFAWIWKPSIYMPRWASRITLEITAVRVERLQCITEEDAKKEGITCTMDACNRPIWGPHGPQIGFCGSPVDAYHGLWESIHGPGSWSLNPWVWVLEFKRVETPSQWISSGPDKPTSKLTDAAADRLFKGGVQ